MNALLDVCVYMDDNDCLGALDGPHGPHNAIPDYDRPQTWWDGDVRKDGHSCLTCGHVVARYPYHTDPRLDIPERPVHSDECDANAEWSSVCICHRFPPK